MALQNRMSQTPQAWDFLSLERRARPRVQPARGPEEHVKDVARKAAVGFSRCSCFLHPVAFPEEKLFFFLNNLLLHQ